MILPPLISVLARSFLAGAPTVEDVYERGSRTLGRNWRWLRPLAYRYVETFKGHTRPRHRDVIRFLLEDSGFRQARNRYADQIYIAEWLAEPRRMQPVAAAQSWQLPPLESAGELADWLSLSVGELEWFADLKGLGYKFDNPRLRHYHYHVLPKRSGVRLIESPKARLKDLQRRILSHVLDKVPAHPAAHGFVKGRSIVTFAQPHVGKHVLLRIDLKDFFPAFPAARVQAIFRTLGYPDTVSDLLGGICTNSVPADVWKQRPLTVQPEHWFETRQLYARPHLPQGGPTSPAIANITAYRLDCRLTGLARTAGAVYTRYADDLAFSGGEEFSRIVKRFSLHAAAIALEEGFLVNHRKTRIMHQGSRQHLAGLVVNQKLSVSRIDRELLEAILTNCVRHGPSSQNRENIENYRAHLEGRVGYIEMISREKGQRLRALLNAVDWEAAPG